MNKFFIIFFLILIGFISSKTYSEMSENSIVYDSISQKFDFNIKSNNRLIIYEYYLDKGYSFNGIKVVFGNYSFQPSYFGGITLVDKTNKEYYPWENPSSYQILNFNYDSDSVVTEWIYKHNDGFYHYKINIFFMNSSLCFRVYDCGPLKGMESSSEYLSASSLLLDRSNNTNKPVIVGVPYLTTFNILYSKDIFCSIYFDWNKTNSSQLLPYNSIYSDSSVYFSQYALYNKKTNGKRNTLDELIYLTVSDNLDDVLPDLSNPIAKYKNESSERIVWDYWLPFNQAKTDYLNLKSKGINNLWLIVHNWQRAGYDKELPDVMPSNINYGGDEVLKDLSVTVKNYNDLFALHENYSDLYSKSKYFTDEDLALNSSDRKFASWVNVDTGYLIKPSVVNKFIIPISQEIHNTFHTNSTFVDVVTSYNPSKYVDYDFLVENSGKFIGPYNSYAKVGETLRSIHEGPVSGEGLSHFLYVGYFDDICAQIHTGQNYPPVEKTGGYYRPLLVNFDLLKMKEKTMVHGVGYYERFFFKNNYWQYMGRSEDSALTYAATELAYGHGAFFGSGSYNQFEQGLLEYSYVYPVQLLYKSAIVQQILYNDNGNLLTASEYIKSYPADFDKIISIHFMSQVYIKYDNGLIICVNRNPNKNWNVEIGKKGGWYCCNILDGEKKVQLIGKQNNSKYILPKENGWLCYFPS